MSLFKSKPKLSVEKKAIPLLSIEKNLAVQPGSDTTVWFPDTSDLQVALLHKTSNENEGVPVRCDHYAVILCLEGTTDVMQNQYEFTLSHSQALFIPAGEIHTFANTSHEYRVRMVLFKSEYLEGSGLSLDELDALLTINAVTAPLISLDESQFDQWKLWFDQIHSELKENRPYQLSVLRHMILLQLYAINRSYQSNDSLPDTRQDSICYEFRELVESHFQQRKTVMEYAQLMHITSKHLSETVKKATNQTALYFIQERIVREAQYLLVYSALNVKQIAQKLSFDTPSHFVRFFKHLTGKTPLKYRQSFA